LDSRVFQTVSCGQIFLIIKISTQNPDCETITYKEALVNGEHKTFALDYVTVEAVQARNNPGHDIRECVGYILTLSDRKKPPKSKMD